VIPGHWLSIPPRRYSYDLVGVVTDDDRVQMVKASAFYVLDENVHPGDAIQVPASQQPLAQGPKGDKGDQGDPGADGTPGGAGVSRYAELNTDYTNTTGTDSVVVSLTFPASGGKNLKIEATGDASLTGNQFGSTVADLTEDYATCHFTLWVDGLQVARAIANLNAVPSLQFGSSFASVNGSPTILKEIGPLSVGDHLIQIKAALDVIPSSGASIIAYGASGGGLFNCFNLFCEEV
jgi:hypothetical protein